MTNKMNVKTQNLLRRKSKQIKHDALLKLSHKIVGGSLNIHILFKIR